MGNLYWKCHICGKERPDECISVLSYQMKKFLSVTINVRYCNDSKNCLEEALEWQEKGEFPKRDTVEVK